MIGYVTLGTNNFSAATVFYDSLFASLDIGRLMEEDNYYIAWGPSMNEPSLAVVVPFNKEPAAVGNGTMVAIAVERPEQVDALHRKALELGGASEGEPGFRSDGNNKGFYAGYFRDLDGNKLNAFCIVE